MDGGFPLIMLIGPLLGAAVALVARGRRRVVAAVGLVSVALLMLLIWLAGPDGGVFGGNTVSFYGRELTLTPFARALFLALYAGLGSLFALSWFRPVGRALVPAGLAVMSPLAAGVMISPSGLGAVFMVVAAAAVVPALHGGRYTAAGATWRYFLFAAAALAPMLMTTALPATSSPAGWLVPLLAVLMLLGGFPFHVWSAPLGRVASPASLALVLGLVQSGVIVILITMLDGVPAARASAEFQTTVRWSAALTALIGALLILRAAGRRETFTGAVVLDMGFLLIATLLPGADGLLLALPALMGRFLGLLLIVAAWRARPAAAGDSRFARARTTLPAVMLAYGLLSLLGLPLTPGFAERWAQLLIAGQSGGQWAAVVLVAAVALGTLGLLRGLPQFTRADEAAGAAVSPAETGLMAVLLGIALLCGAWPDLLTTLASRMLGLG